MSAERIRRACNDVRDEAERIRRIRNDVRDAIVGAMARGLKVGDIYKAVAGAFEDHGSGAAVNDMMRLAVQEDAKS